jgi:hypothetical protein
MPIDLAALKAKLAAQKTVPTDTPVVTTPTVQVTNETNTQVATTGGASGNSGSTVSSAPAPTINAPTVLGTSKTTEIDHLDFLAKMNSLAEAIHNQHPTMPVLLMQIHKQLRADPELVTTLEEDAIGIIVKGLQIQTKTELIAAATKPTRAKKNPAVSIDMF